MGRWVAGIMATIIASLAFWWLTKLGGILNPESTGTAPAKLGIVSAQIGDVVRGGRATATISVYNNSSTVLEDCVLWWFSGSRVSPHHFPKDRALSQPFGLRPAETKTVIVLSLPYTEAGDFDSRISVECTSNGKRLGSDWLTRRVHVAS